MRRKKEEILNEIVPVVKRLSEMSSKDPDSLWTPILLDLIDRSVFLQKNNGSETEVRELCGTIRNLFGGKDESFSEYQPSLYDKSKGEFLSIPGTADFGELSSKLYELAEEIRTVGQY